VAFSDGGQLDMDYGHIHSAAESDIQTLKKIHIHGNTAYNEITAKTIKQH